MPFFLNTGLSLVNVSKVEQKIKVSFKNSDNKIKMIDYNEFKLNPNGVNFFLLKLPHGENGIITINSKLVMSRPVVLRISGHSMDIFHG